MNDATTPRWSPPGLPAPPPAVAVAVLVLLSWPLIFFGLSRYGVVNADEAFYHDIAWTMLETGDWFRLRTGPGEHVYDTFANAPLQYWLRGLAISHVGPDMLGMRIVTALSALLAVLATYVLTLRVGGRRAAFLGGLVLLTSFQFLYLHSARTGELEPGVCLLLVLMAHFFLRATLEPDRGFVAHHVVLALLVGWKAPVAPVPVIAELACFALIPEVRARLPGWLRTGIFVLPFALVWHVGQAFRLGSVLPEIILQIGQSAGGADGHGPTHRVFYYAHKLLFGGFPYSLLQPIALAALAGRALRGRAIGRPTPLALRVLCLYTLAILLFYVAISKTGPWYVVHAMPFLAILVALWLTGLQERGLSWAVVLSIAVALSLLFWLAPPLAGYNPFERSAIAIGMPLGWRTFGALQPLPAVLATAGVLLVPLSLAKRRLGARFSPLLALMLAVVFIGYALVRCLLPLAYVDHLSPLATMAANLDERRRAGAAIPLPIELPPAHPWTVHYYFGRDYLMQFARDPKSGTPPAQSRFVLIESRAGSRAREAAPALRH
ncbi:MAG: glycosyltransferase family 39 protein [Deltaproteobacteria bacterium]|nr:glycosyltransferase family 39 protein [Deltaproteobacteria bacterium]MBW2384741.1 glycosyltransferase family 39 protein [Deltaproteobacteria bacterium]